MPSRDSIHDPVKSSLQRSGWQITADPYVISYGERFLFVDLGAESVIIGSEQENIRIAIEIKALRGRSIMAELEQAIGQYVLYQILLAEVDPDRKLYLAITTQTYSELFQEPIGQLVLMQTGWNGGQRVRGNLIYITIENCQINVEYDGIEQGITQDLTEQGIPISQITHTFLSQSATLVEA